MRVLVLSRNASLYSTSRLVRAGRARGHEVDVIDPLALQLVVARGEPGLSYGGSRMARYHVVIPRFGASASSYALSVLGQLEQSGVVVLNTAGAIALARDKVRSLQVLARGRLRVPRTVSTRSLEGVDAALALVGAYPAILKLQSGTQGIGTMIAESPRAACALLETLWAMGQEIVVQEYIAEARGRDLRAFVVGGKVVAAMRRTAQRGEFRANLHRGGRAERVALPPRYRRAALRAAELLELEICGVDMLETSEGPVVLEVNCSPGLEGIEGASEVDVAGAILERAAARADVDRSRRAASC